MTAGVAKVCQDDQSPPIEAGSKGTDVRAATDGQRHCAGQPHHANGGQQPLLSAPCLPGTTSKVRTAKWLTGSRIFRGTAHHPASRNLDSGLCPVCVPSQFR